MYLLHGQGASLKEMIKKNAMMQYFCVLHPDYFPIALPKSNFDNKTIKHELYLNN